MGKNEHTVEFERLIEERGEPIRTSDIMYVFADGSACRYDVNYGCMPLDFPQTDPERAVKYRGIFLQRKLARLQRDFINRRHALQEMIDHGSPVPDEGIATLKELQEKVIEAAEAYEAFLNPPDVLGPDVAKAKTLLRRLEKLADENRKAEQAYKDLETKLSGKTTARLEKLAKDWETVYGEWEAVNEKVKNLPREVWNRAVGELHDERKADTCYKQREQLANIQI